MGFYAMQNKAWMDEAVMVTWIEKRLLPWKDTLPPDATPLLILDSFHVHMMEKVIKNTGAWNRSPIHPWWLHVRVPTN